MPSRKKARITERLDQYDENTWWMVDLELEPRPTQGATPLVRRCMNAYGWSEAYARKVLKAYKQFLCIKAKKKDWNAELLSPPVAVDQIWHQHIIDNVNYYHDSMLLCRHMVGHKPDEMYNVEGKKQRRAATATALLEYFDRDSVETSKDGVWSQVFHEETALEPSFIPPTNAQAPAVSTADVTSPTTETPMEIVELPTMTPGESKPPPDTIIIRVKDFTEGVRDGQETWYKVNRETTRMGAIFYDYSSRIGLDSDCLRFLLDGDRVDPHHTPTILGLEDQDLIVIFSAQGGC
jgi:hypothetical protein